MLGLYIHVPFCKKICDYCDFSAFPAAEWLHLEYLKLLSEEFSCFCRSNPEALSRVDTVYVGGGTPSVLKAPEIERLFQILKDVGVPLENLRECSMEFNPESVDEERVAVAMECGVDRISVGIQSFRQELLERVGRSHDASMGKDALVFLLERRNLRVNADLMFNLPGQDVDTLLADVSTLCDMGVSHVSLYGLKVDPRKRLGRRIAKGLESVDEDLYAEMYERSVGLLESRGLQRYEVSNFAVPGEESVHNLNYWNRGEYLAFGPSSHGYLDGVRYSLPESYAAWRRYVRLGCPRDLLSTDRIGPEEAVAECVQLSLRTRSGLSLDELARMGREIPSAILEKWEARGYLSLEDGRVRLTGRGFLFMDSVVLDLYSNLE